MLKLYYHPFSTFSRRVRIALVEKGVSAEEIEVDMASRAHRAPEYLRLNPYGRVPTIDHIGSRPNRVVDLRKGKRDRDPEEAPAK